MLSMMDILFFWFQKKAEINPLGLPQKSNDRYAFSFLSVNRLELCIINLFG